MRVYAAVFGEENFEWPYCKEHGTVATLNETSAQALWEKGDKEAYILNRMQTKTVRGHYATRQVASTWFNLMTIISETEGDIWIHKDGDHIWWTRSKSDPHYFMEKVEPVGARRNVVICHKPCEPWSSVDAKGRPLLWHVLHPKAKDFLTTQSTLRPLSAENAEYALALINGQPLDRWHALPDWKTKFEKVKTKHADVTYVVGQERAAYTMALRYMPPEERMANTAFKTVKASNGQTVERTVKNKEFRFSDRMALAKYITGLLETQENLCALTGLKMDYEEDGGDQELYCSLDRIDSDKHYEPGNLQVVCRFANSWKGSYENDTFLRLVEILKRESGAFST